jgi:hypothetical protein
MTDPLVTPYSKLGAGTKINYQFMRPESRNYFQRILFIQSAN